MKILNIILILLTSASTATAANNGPQLSADELALLSNVLRTDTKEKTMTVHYNAAEDNELPACSQDLANTFAANPVLRINDLRAIVLDYYKNDLEVIKHASIKQERAKHLSTTLSFSPNAAQLTVTVTRLFDIPWQPWQYPELNIVEETGQLPVSGKPVYSPARVYAAQTTHCQFQGFGHVYGVVLYRNKSTLLANALKHTKPKQQTRNNWECLIQ